MLIKDMTREMNIDLLKSINIGHIACSQNAQSYLTPFSFAYHDNYIYSVAALGKKIDWMRANASVCVQADKIVSREDWKSVVIVGRYEELPKTAEFFEVRKVALDVLARTHRWWEPGCLKPITHDVEPPFEPIYFRILIDDISGRQAMSADI